MARPPWTTSTVPANDGEAARFLTQTTYGPRLEDIAALRQSTYEAWLTQQFELPPSLHLPFVLQRDAEEVEADNDYPHFYYFREAWFDRALTAPDQLRQRVAFALSQIFVVSERGGFLADEGQTLGGYYDILVRQAFGNYRQLLEEVTLNPAMARYLSLYKNRMADPELGIRPDENYAREVLQLFSIGLVELNLDGTPRLDAQGNPIPTYDQQVIKGFARVFTGWGCARQDNFEDYDICDSVEPLKPFEDYHEPGPKLLLNGVEIPGADTREDLRLALDNIFAHPNVGPFIGRQLIQRLVTSNPTPAYVERIARVFNDNGAGDRGDLGAVVAAIVLDPEAREGPTLLPDRFGKVREPLRRLTHLCRAFDRYRALDQILVGVPPLRTVFPNLVRFSSRNLGFLG